MHNSSGFHHQRNEKIEVRDLADVSSGTISREVLLQLLDICPIVLLLKDKNGVYVHGNRQAHATVPPPGRGLLGMPDSYATMVGGQYEAWRTREVNCMQFQMPIVSQQQWTAPDGSYYVHEVVNVPIIDKSGSSIGVGVIAHDITHKAYQMTASRLMEMLRHDWVKGLLTSLITRIEIQIRKAAGPELDSVVVGGHTLPHLKRVFEFMQMYLLYLPSLVGGRSERIEESLAQHDFFTEVLGYMNAIAPIVVFGVRVQWDEGSRAVVFGDINLLRVMCYEFMKNHQKYGDTDVPLVVSVGGVSTENDFIILSFKSVGQKISDAKAYKESLFMHGKRFNCGSVEGTGNGLSFCKAVALAHNGVAEAYPNEHRERVYGAFYDGESRANVFWLRFRKAV